MLLFQCRKWVDLRAAGSWAAWRKSQNEYRYDKWCYFLKNLENFDHIPAILNEPIFQKAFGTAELAALTTDQRAMYEENLIQYWGMKSALETAAEAAVEAATEATKTKIAQNAILAGADSAFIATITGLSVEAIDALRARLHST